MMRNHVSLPTQANERVYRVAGRIEEIAAFAADCKQEVYGMLKMLRRRLSARIRLGSVLRAFKQKNLDGKSEDWIKGWIEGWFESRQQGQADLLCRMLAHRFGSLPSDTVAQILAADVEQIEEWTDEGMFATTLAEVFSTDRA